MTTIATRATAHEAPRTKRPLRRGTVRAALTGTATGVFGVAPHVLHHVGFLAGTALVAGSGGTALFAGIGFVASLPLLLRLRRRFDTWIAPVVGLAVFTAMFAVSAFVIGPGLSGNGGSGSPGSPPSVGHLGHH